MPGAVRIRVPRTNVEYSTEGGVKKGLIVLPSELLAYDSYQLRLTAVGYGSVYSQWSQAGVAGAHCCWGDGGKGGRGRLPGWEGGAG